MAAARVQTESHSQGAPVKVIRSESTEGTGQRPRTADLAAGPQADTVLPVGGFLGSLPTGILVARQEEMWRILATVAAVEGNAGRLALLAGEAGVGKTRLAQEVTLVLRNRGFLLAAGRCYEAQESVPYYPFLEALTHAYEAALTRLYNQAGWQSEQLVATQRLLELAHALRDERLLAEAELHRGVSLMHTGQYEEALQVLEDAIPRSDGVGDLSTWQKWTSCVETRRLR